VAPGISGREQTAGGGVDAEGIGTRTRVEPDGSFFWRLPRGTYVIPEIRYGYTVIPRMVFQVPFGGDAVYIGTLTINVTTDKVAGNRLLKEVRSVEVNEEFYSSRIDLFRRFGDAKGNYFGEIVRGPMVHLPTLPSSIAALAPSLITDGLKDVGLTLLNENEPGSF